MTIVKTNINHNIDEAEFKHTIAHTASLIRYQGKEYLDKLKLLNAEYEVVGAKLITDKELHTKQVEKC
jgi:hypothetical protein